MLPATKASTNKSVQGEVHSKSEDTSVIMNKLAHATTVSLEDQTNKNCEMKTERKNSKDVEAQKKAKLRNENLTDLKREHSKAEIVESKDTEVTTKKVETEEDEESNNLKQLNVPKCKMIPVADKSDAQKPSNAAVPRKRPPLSAPLLNEPPLVLTTHLVPSLPISLFEVLVEAIEIATEKPVVLLYEPRSDRPVAKDVANIAILPASMDWEDGELLPATFCFEHHLNKTNSPCVYADVIVAADRAPYVEDITDLRGHRCSLPDRKKQIGAAALLFNYLHTKGESPAFFGNTLDADTQVATLQMVAGKQAEIGILESPVIKCHKNSLPGINSLYILTSLGPLPPYRIMVKNTIPDILIKKITAYLLNINEDKEWTDRFAPFGITGFAKNSESLYELSDVKSVATSVRYY